MIKLALIALSSALVATSPAAAEGTRAAEPASAGSVAAAAVVGTVALPVARTAATQRYCIVDTITGSLIARRMCHTRDQWLVRGFDPVAAR